MAPVAKAGLFSWLILAWAAVCEELRVNVGEDATCQCLFPRHAVVEMLEWTRRDLRSDDYVFFYRNHRSYEEYQHPYFHGRVKLRDPEMKDGNVSVVLKNVTISDTGTYECYVGCDGKRELINTITLSITDSGHTPGNIWDGEKTHKINDGERKNVIIGLTVGLSAALLVAVVDL